MGRAARRCGLPGHRSPGRRRTTLDRDDHLAKRLSTAQALVCLADLFEAEPRFVEQRLEGTRIHEPGQLREDGAVSFALVVVEHRNQHEDDVQRQALEVGRRQVQFEQGNRRRDVRVQCGRF